MHVHDVKFINFDPCTTLNNTRDVQKRSAHKKGGVDNFKKSYFSGASNLLYPDSSECTRYKTRCISSTSSIPSHRPDQGILVHDWLITSHVI